MKKVGGRFTLLALVVVLSVVSSLPSIPAVFQTFPPWVKRVFPNKGITLGLDLQGGIHLVLEVEEDRAVEIAVDRSVNAIQDLLVEKKIPVESVTRTGPAQVTLAFQKEDRKPEIQKVLEEFSAFAEKSSGGSAGRSGWRFGFSITSSTRTSILCPRLRRSPSQTVRSGWALWDLRTC